jgi:hypothetical protein
MGNSSFFSFSYLLHEINFGCIFVLMFLEIFCQTASTQLNSSTVESLTLTTVRYSEGQENLEVVFVAVFLVYMRRQF